MIMSKPEIRVVGGVFYRTQQGVRELLLFRRKRGETGAGLYEFPGGKIEIGESDEQALKRELEEELGLQAKVQSFIGESVFEAPSRYIRLRAYFVTTDRMDFKLTDHDDFIWVKQEQINLEQIVPADRPLIPLCFK